MQMPARARSIVSYNMSRIRSNDTQPEKVLEGLMTAAGLEFEKQYPIEGKPDFAFPTERVAVFCDSSFWHGYKWAYGGREKIKVRRDFWIPKIERNIQRDREVNVTLRARSWRVLRLWDFEINRNPTACLSKIRKALARRRW